MADNVIVRVPEQQFIRGEDGYSPVVTVEEIEHGHSVTITDRDHHEGQSFDVLDGASAYEQAVAGGYTGTEAQFNEELASFKELSEQAADSANTAAGAAFRAQNYERHAGDAEDAARAYADIALIRMNSADASATAAAASATAASQSKDDAASSATAAAGSATAAAGSASTASTAATTAQGHATNAASSATAASGSATAAASSATAAGNAQTAAETAQGAAEDAQEAAEAVLASIPADYTELSGDVDDLKSAVTLYTGNAEIEFVKDKYIDTSGSTVDLSSPVNSTTGYGYAVVDCAEGDNFTVTATGGQRPRAWCFIDAENNALTKSAESVSVINRVITAPANTAKLVINAKYETEKSYYGKILKNRVDDLESQIDNTDPLFNKLIKLPDNDSFFDKGTATAAGTYTKIDNHTFSISGGSGTTYYNYPLHGTSKVIVGTNAQMAARLTPSDLAPIPEGGAWGSTTFSVGLRIYSEANTTVNARNTQIYVWAANVQDGEFIETPVIVASIVPADSTKYGTNILRLRGAGYAPLSQYTHYGIYASSRSRASNAVATTRIDTVQSPRIMQYILYPLNAIELTNIATRAYAVNRFIIFNERLYRVTSAITAGMEIIEGTNVEQTSILEVLTELLNRG